ncbi:DUF4352 domain-containing protein [Lactococcus lactis]|uniref:DUF4352 domain-containing protein n=1 Tax=Lactococcus lactis TaxID=1358 RepID=UPI00288E577F|nr:DUF4352 domain-containing protein [Lactococcus lactis]MDT2872868.1 DUF4352 domain-containing protein [Lactococcus lactis]MDT2934705.1 DUF4352 domain-containing protein [Lactococcus lactis]
MKKIKVVVFALICIFLLSSCGKTSTKEDSEMKDKILSSENTINNYNEKIKFSNLDMKVSINSTDADSEFTKNYKGYKPELVEINIENTDDNTVYINPYEYKLYDKYWHNAKLVSVIDYSKETNSIAHLEKGDFSEIESGKVKSILITYAVKKDADSSLVVYNSKDHFVIKKDD